MRDIFSILKEQYESSGQITFDHEEAIPIEEKLQYLILKQRYTNLREFLERQKKYYQEIEIEELQNILFFYNDEDLKEINFIGTDLFANTLFLKNKVPYLYRSVGKDTKEEKVLGEEKVKYPQHVERIFEECVAQIKTGGRGNLFSYSKCFGKMLYKYAALLPGDEKETIEIRRGAAVNAISEDGKNILCIQQYIRNCKSKGQESGNLPYFVIDMSNARENEVAYLKEWIEGFLGEQNWRWHSDIVDPIGDAEVVCNFTNVNREILLYESCERREFDKNEFCALLYEYFKKYAEVTEIREAFTNAVDKSLDTLIDFEEGKLRRYYSDIRDGKSEGVDYAKISEILAMVDWKKEQEYMPKKKGKEDGQEDRSVPSDLYKGENAERDSRVWKEILSNAINRRWTNYSRGQ